MMTTNQIPIQTTSTEAFDDRIDILFRELELAIRWQRPSILLAVFNSDHIHNEVESILKSRLLAVGQDVHCFKIEGEENSDIPAYLTNLPHLEQKVIFVEGFKLGGGQENAHAYRTLNIGRDYFVNRQVRVIFWLTVDEANDLAHYAPEFWGYRHRVVEFLEHIDPSQSPLRTLGSIWQGIGEYADGMEDIDNRIALRDSLLSELPEKNESTSVRANLLISLGVLHWRKGDIEKAIGLSQSALQLATKIDDKWFEAFCFNSLALIQANSGQVSEAIDALKRASSLAPDQIFPWNNLGNLFSELDRFDEALEAFQTAKQCNPRDPMCLNGLGTVYFKLGRTNDAFTNYQQAIQLAPTFAHAWNGLGNIYASQDQIEAAISAFQKAIELDHHLAMPWISLGSIFEKLNRLEEAADAFQKAFELDPANALVWNEQGKIYLNTGSYDEAVCAFQKSIELDHGNGWSYCNLAQTYVCKGKYTEAIQLYHKSIKLFKSNTEKAITWSRLGNIYQQKNDIENAITAKQIALELDPENEQIKDELIEIHNSLNIQNPKSKMTMDNTALQRFLMDASSELGPDTTIAKILPQAKPFSESLNIKSAHDLNEHGNALLNTGAYGEATQAYNKAIEIDHSFGWPHANLALVAVNNGKYADAIPLYQKSLKLLKTKLEKAVVWNRLGIAYRKLNDYIKAIQAHRKALELDPKNISARQDLIRIHNDLGHIKAAINLLTASLDKASAWNMLGNAYRRLSDYEAATEAFQKAVDLAPDDYAFKFDLEESIKEARQKSHPFLNRRQNTGNEYYEEIKIALKDTGETSSIDENQPGPLGELIDIQSDLRSGEGDQLTQVKELFDPRQETRANYPIGEPARRNSEAIPTRRSLTGAPAPAHLSNGGDAITAGITQKAASNYRNMWRLDETLSSFHEMTESMPVESLDPALLVYHRAVELVSVGSGKESFVNELETFTPLPAPLPDTRPTVVNPRLRKPLEFIVAKPALIIEQPKEEAFEETQPQEGSPVPAPTITRVPAQPENNDAGKLERDILTYKTVTGINPKNARAWHTLGNLQRSAGQFDEAAESLEKAVELDPRQEVFHYHLGLVYAAQNRYEEAVETFRKVLSINPEYNLAHATLAGYYSKLGKTKESQYHMAIARRTMQDEKEYNQACFEAICGNAKRAIELLKIALKENQTTLDWVRRDPDFVNIRTDAHFQALTAG
jgi:tetratricopeptide (TPR) repeat protein